MGIDKLSKTAIKNFEKFMHWVRFALLLSQNRKNESKSEALHKFVNNMVKLVDLAPFVTTLVASRNLRTGALLGIRKRHLPCMTALVVKLNYAIGTGSSEAAMNATMIR